MCSLTISNQNMLRVASNKPKILLVCVGSEQWIAKLDI